MRPERLEEFRRATEHDDVMLSLKTTIMNGWPSDKSTLPSTLNPYYSFADELSVQDGIIFKGERVVVPTSLRSDMKRVIHTAHLGVSGCLRRARESYYSGLA